MLHFGFDIFASSKILRILELICKYTNLWLKAFETPSSRSLVRVSAVDCSKYKSFFFFLFAINSYFTSEFFQITEHSE